VGASVASAPHAHAHVVYYTLRVDKTRVETTKTKPKPRIFANTMSHEAWRETTWRILAMAACSGKVYMAALGKRKPETSACKARKPHGRVIAKE